VVFLLLCLLGYTLGSISFGKIIGRMRGVDIQKKGSGNIGFANAVRVLGWKPAIFVLLGDSLKGYFAILIAKHFVSEQQLLIIGLFALIGHCFPIWLKFKGGKGIATGLGITLAVRPLLGGIGFGIYLLVMLIARKSAVASLVSAWSLPLICLVLYPNLAWYFGLTSVFVTWTHRSNIRAIRHERSAV
jgi:acyl phosphate:glycerol-3-phosphate acyltransferase